MVCFLVSKEYFRAVESAMVKYKLAIIGSTPPPIGGVTIHTRRLYDHAKSEHIDAKLFNISIFNKGDKDAYSLIRLVDFLLLNKNKVVHYQGSQLIGLISLMLLKIIFRFKLIWSIHSEYTIPNIKEGSLKKRLIKKLEKNMNMVICDNINIHKQVNDYLLVNTIILSPFFPPINFSNIKLDLTSHFKSDAKIIVFNAYKLVFNTSGEDVYGLDIFCESLKLMAAGGLRCNVILLIPEFCANSELYLKKQTAWYESQENVEVKVISNSDIEGWRYIKSADIFVRPTITDGDALSVRESLFFDTPVVASDCTSRPLGVVLYKNKNSVDLADKLTGLLTIEHKTSNPAKSKTKSPISLYDTVYAGLFNKDIR